MRGHDLLIGQTVTRPLTKSPLDNAGSCAFFCSAWGSRYLAPVAAGEEVNPHEVAQDCLALAGRHAIR